MAAKNWCFTWNTASPERSLDVGVYIAQLVECFSVPVLPGGFGYLVFQRERGEHGTDHVQGYAQFSTRRSFKQAKESLNTYFDGCHLEKAKGSPEQNRDYCTKEDTRIEGPWEFGNISKPGKRNDLKDFIDALPLSDEQIFELFPHIMARYPNFVRTAKRRCRRLESVCYEPRGQWQLDLISYCNAPSHPREVRWYYDQTGNSGKSYFCRNFGVGYVVTGGKHADIYYAYNYEPYVFFDWPRSSEDQFPYGVVEAFKNGYFLSTKYESAAVTFQPPIVIVFSNFPPDETKLSADRWDIVTI